jgi:hypothetical protein
MRYNKEEIKYKENEGQELIYKGEAKFGEDEEIEELTLEEVCKQLGKIVKIIK